MEIVKDLRLLKSISAKSNGEWVFDTEYKYHIGKTYTNCKFVIHRGERYELKYYSGCFNPYCIKVDTEKTKTYNIYVWKYLDNTQKQLVNIYDNIQQCNVEKFLKQIKELYSYYNYVVEIGE